MAKAEIRPELVLDARAKLGEGPTWDRPSGQLIWVDIDAGMVHRFDPATAGTDSIAVGQPVGAAVPRRGGGLALAVRDGFALLDAGADTMRLAAPVEAGDPDTRLNDGACDVAGRFWAGSLSACGCPAAALYRWTGDGPPERVVDGITLSNGIGWSPDERRMYYIDTVTGGVDVFDFDPASGEIANRRRAISIDRSLGRPDGLAVDADGGVWVALWGGGAVHRYAPSGSLDRRVRFPVSQVTSCCFGDHDLRTLFITSAARGVVEDHAGALFACRPGCAGLPAHAFGG